MTHFVHVDHVHVQTQHGQILDGRDTALIVARMARVDVKAVNVTDERS